MYLRDILDDLAKRKLRDVSDFEWKRNIRFYGQKSEPMLNAGESRNLGGL